MFGRRDAFAQTVRPELVHQETDRAEIHAVDTGPGLDRGVQRVEHETVAAQGDDRVGLVQRDAAIQLFKACFGSLGFRPGTGQEGK